MIILDDRHLLMIEPRNGKQPYILDDLTQKAELVYMRAKTPQYGYRGFHQCVCGVTSDNLDHILPDGTITNSLMVHYIAEHRAEVPQSEIDKLERLYMAFTDPHIIGEEQVTFDSWCHSRQIKGNWKESLFQHLKATRTGADLENTQEWSEAWKELLNKATSRLTR